MESSEEMTKALMKTFKTHILVLLLIVARLGLLCEYALATPVFVNLGPNKTVKSVTTDSSGNAYLVGYERDVTTGRESAILVTIPAGSTIPSFSYLPTLEGFSDTRATSIRGDYIVGFGNLNSESQGIAWNLRDLSSAIPVVPAGVPGRGDATQLFGVNSSGQYAGSSADLSIAITGNVGGNSQGINVPGTPSIVTGISESGVTTGRYVAAGNSSLQSFVATSPNSFVNLINPYSDSSVAYAISPNSQIVGGSLLNFDPATETNDLQAAVWTGTNYNDLTLLSLPNGSPLFGQVLSVTNNGYAVGNSNFGGFIWQAGWTSAQLFNDWAFSSFGISIPTWVTSVNDVFFDGESLNFALQGSAYFVSVPVAGATTAVPEPSSIILIALALFITTINLSRKKSQLLS